MNLQRASDDTRAWAFYFLIVACSTTLNCRLGELRDEVASVRRALPDRPDAIRACAPP